jgi:predicted transposase YbfD/YdcC
MLHEEKIIIAQHRIPDETTETTQVKELLEPVDLDGAVVTADAAHAQREIAEYIAGPAEDGGRDADYFPFVKGNQPGVQRAVFDLIQAAGRKAPDHVELDYGHGRIIKRSLWVTGAGDLDFPRVTRVARIRRDCYDLGGALISKEVVHAVTSLDADQASAADLAAIARGQWGIESVHWLRDTAWAEDAGTGYAGNGPRSWPPSGISRSACSITPASRKSPAPSRPSAATGPACSAICRDETGITNDFADPVHHGFQGVYVSGAVVSFGFRTARYQADDLSEIAA